MEAMSAARLLPGMNAGTHKPFPAYEYCKAGLDQD